MGLMPSEVLEPVAAYFHALSEPTRLRILNLLCQGERNVGELAEQCGYTTANVSRHLSVLKKNGLVTREARGNNVYYQIADPSVNALCDLVCGSILRQLEDGARQRAAFASMREASNGLPPVTT
uniref:ArsR/SmtB family transcription factor n=1 Tax=Castellaniella defragrans TaxID=75697 RepID=UPI00333F8383